eukprot:CAMPEP_0205932822 /NCGR_PEP_ID=MMETSP1325-20131115/31115_1 /ASSEMBLY_ACC=CAM_ASM_000708 /TAXON_ID=236786 /ORGANISM="Florenciella sp., Strain RCC1007" /LENGTH=143 /DNA_ID=CAMNT_0053302589 /DNA_START=27 /DNA_END=454 /DNA_ORIENTATION=+
MAVDSNVAVGSSPRPRRTPLRRFCKPHLSSRVWHDVARWDAACDQSKPGGPPKPEEGGGGKPVSIDALASLKPLELGGAASPSTPALASVAPSVTSASEAEGQRDLAASPSAPSLPVPAVSSPEPEPLLASMDEPLLASIEEP